MSWEERERSEIGAIDCETSSNGVRGVSQMSNPYWSRRKLLEVAGAGILGTNAISYTVSGQEDTSGGDEIWSVDVSAHSLTPPTVVDGTVFIGTDAHDVHAVDAGTGNRQWKFRTEGLGNRAPHVVGNTVFIGNRNRSENLQKATVYALDANTGDERRTYTFGPDDYGGVWSSPTVANGTILVQSYSSGLYALNATDGTEQWQFEPAIPYAPPVVEDAVFVGGRDGNAYALDAATGEQQWESEVGNSSGWVTFADNTVFVSAEGTVTDDDSRNSLSALDADTGDERWTFRTESDLYRPTVADGTVFFSAGDVHALDAVTGDELWTFDTNMLEVSSPTVADGTAFIVGGGYQEPGLVYALDAATGTEKWSVEVDNTFRTLPIVVGGVLFVGDIVGTLYAFDAGVEGSSEDSRVNLGTLNHHDEWANTQSGKSLGEPADSTTAEDSNQENGPSDNTGDADSGQEDEPADNTTGDAGPGFGVGGALAGIGGAAYLFYRRLTGKETESR